jgi:phosphopantothenoylcysteine decarboxylase
MWRNPITEKQMRVLSEDWGIKEGTCADGQNRSITGWFKVITVGIPSHPFRTPY